MSLREHGLSEHFEFPESLDDSDRVKLIHELFFGLLKQEVLLVGLAATVVSDVSDAKTSKHVLQDVPESVVEAGTI